MKCETLFGGPNVIGYKADDGIQHLLQHHHGTLDDDVCTVVSDCLEPIVMTGERVSLVDGTPTPWQLAMFHIKGEGMGRLKIYLGTFDRGAQHIAVYGDNQPNRVVAFVALRPLAVHIVAESDLDRLRPVRFVGGIDGFRDVSAGVSIEPEQWQAIQQALAA